MFYILVSGQHQHPKENDLIETCDVSAAFLGPTLWEKTLSYDDFKTDNMGLDEFLFNKDKHGETLSDSGKSNRRSSFELFFFILNFKAGATFHFISKTTTVILRRCIRPVPV